MTDDRMVKSKVEASNRGTLLVKALTFNIGKYGQKGKLHCYYTVRAISVVVMDMCLFLSIVDCRWSVLEGKMGQEEAIKSDRQPGTLLRRLVNVHSASYPHSQSLF